MALSAAPASAWVRPVFATACSVTTSFAADENPACPADRPFGRPVAVGDHDGLVTVATVGRFPTGSHPRTSTELTCGVAAWRGWNSRREVPNASVTAPPEIASGF